MIGLICFLLLFFCGVADAQIVSPTAAPPVVVSSSTIPNGAPPQVLGYSASNVPEAETLIGDVTLARTGSSQYTATVTKINGAAVGTLATLNVGAGLVAGSGNLNLVVPVAIASGGTGTITAPLVGQILIAQTNTAYGPMPVGGDITMAVNGQVTVLKVNGATPGGTCSANQFVNVISSSGVPTCAAPTITGVPSGGPPQIVGYSATNVGESETVSGGPGNCTYTRTGANAYSLTCSGYVTANNPTFTGTVTMPDGSTWNSTGLTAATGSFVNLSATNLSVANINITSGTGGINLPIGGIYYQPGYNPPSLPAYWDQYGIQKMEKIGIGQGVGSDPLDITANVNGAAQATILNNSTGTGAYAAYNLTNGTNTARIQLGGTALAGGANNLLVWADQGILYSSHNSLPQQFAVNGTTVATIASNGLHLANPLEVSSGGTGTTTAPTQNQILVAQGTSSYLPVTMSGDVSIISTGATVVNNIGGVPAGVSTSWTPSWGVDSGTVTATYNSQVGRYVQFNQSFFYYLDMNWASFSTTGGSFMKILGFPVTPTQTMTSAAAGWAGINLAGPGAGNTALNCVLYGSTSSSPRQIWLSAMGNNIAGYTSMGPGNLAAHGDIQCSGWGVTAN